MTHIPKASLCCTCKHKARDFSGLSFAPIESEIHYWAYSSNYHDGVGDYLDALMKEHEKRKMRNEQV